MKYLILLSATLLILSCSNEKCYECTITTLNIEGVTITKEDICTDEDIEGRNTYKHYEDAVANYEEMNCKLKK